MISFLRGKIIHKSLTSVSLLTSGGVGYEIFLVPTVLENYKVGKDYEFFIYFKVSENFINLYGFDTIKKKNFFEILISVSGVGPKSALHILTLGSLEDISSAIARKDLDYLTRVSGIGKKTAERMVVELKNKVASLADFDTMEDENVNEDVLDGLLALGYSRFEVREIVKQLDIKNKTTEELLRDALRLMQR